MTATIPRPLHGRRDVSAPSGVAATNEDPRVRLLERMGEPLDPDDYDWSAGGAVQLTDEEVFQLRYATQVEWGTEGTFHSLGTTNDPVIRRFLDVWLDQEIVHAELLGRVLASQGHAVAPIHRAPGQVRAARRGRRISAAARRCLGDDFTALHMTWGAVNELTTLRFYGMIRDGTDSPLLTEVLRDVMAQESLHYAFYHRAAVELLGGNPRGQRLVRWALRHLWSPVGVGLRSRTDADRLILGLLGGTPEVARKVDAAIGTVPGLAGLDLIEGCLEQARRSDRRATSKHLLGRNA